MLGRVNNIKLTVLILESDARPVRPGLIKRLLQNIGKKLKEDDRTLVRLHGIFPKNERESRTVPRLSGDYQLVQTLFDPMGAGAYIVKPYASSKSLASSESFLSR